MNRPELQDLLKKVENVLAEFEPCVLMYFDSHGTRVRNPRKLRDMISNELWFRIWEAKQNKDDRQQVRGIIYPFVRDDSSWDVTNRIFQRISAKTNTESDSLLVVFEVLYRLIEYDADTRNAEAYVGHWDSTGKAWRARCLRKAEEFLNNLKPILRSEPRIETLLETIELLKQDRESTFNKVSFIIAEEQKVSNQIDDLIAKLKDTKEKRLVYDLISEQISPAIRGRTAVPESLTRPCLQLLTDPDVDVSSGLQYEASSILGELKDVRSMGVLLNSLRTCEPGHTNLRCNLIYAIGNLRQRRALNHLVNVLAGPDSIHVQLGESSSGYDQPLLSEKQEAIWALGKLGPYAVEAIPVLVKCSQIPNREMKISLAWAMGTIGYEQKSKYNGIDAGIVMTLMNLLTAKDSEIFEEAALALRKLDLPNFLHTLYLHHFTTATALSLRPSSTGLYELSETILHLVSIKKPVVMAVTGDSGTGKTYFCESIVSGFGGVQKKEILHLQRDHPGHMRILNRILGIKWLKGHVDQLYYQDYPLSESEDNPDEFFDNFIKDHSQVRLIILDGWRDEPYFHQIVRAFYKKGYLDILVKFRTSYSTRRINLEERERSLESVKTRLSLVEEPVIEETKFYREGAVLIYNLDNSISSRLNTEEIREVFQRKKVDGWADQIRIGKFEKNVRPLRIHEDILSSRWENASIEKQEVTPRKASRFTLHETTFSRIINENIAEEPNLLQIIKLDDLSINRIAFYTHGQLACGGYDGSVGILTGFNNRIYYHRAHHKKVEHLAVVGGDICSIDSEGWIEITTFQKDAVIKVEQDDSPVSSIGSYLDGQILTGHLDGTIKIRSVLGQQVTILHGHEKPVCAMVVDSRGRIFSGSRDGELRLWNVEDQRVKVFGGQEVPISKMGLFPDGRVVLATDLVDKSEERKFINGAEIKIVDSESGVCETFRVSDTGSAKALNVYFDGRIILGLTSSTTFGSAGNLLIIDPRPDFLQYKVLGGQRLETRDCLTMGPRIITCGSESKSEQTLRIWGTEHYVQMELDKLALMPESMEKPPHYRTLF